MVLAIFSIVSPKISNHMVLEYGTRSPTLLVQVDSPLFAHFSESLGYASPYQRDAVEEYPSAQRPPPRPSNTKTPEPRGKLLSTPVASGTGPVVSPKYDLMDGQAKAA